MCERAGGSYRQLRLNSDDQGRRAGATVAGEQPPPIFQARLLSQDKKTKVTSNLQISFSSLNSVCWISNSSSIGFLQYAFSAERCVFFPSVFLVSGKSQGRCPRTLDPARGLLLSCLLVTKPHLPAQFFSGKNTCLLCLWTFKRRG